MGVQPGHSINPLLTLKTSLVLICKSTPVLVAINCNNYVSCDQMYRYFAILPTGKASLGERRESFTNLVRFKLPFFGTEVNLLCARFGSNCTLFENMCVARNECS